MDEFITKPLGELTSIITKGIAPKYTEQVSDNTIVVLNQKCNRNYSISLEQSRLNDCSKKAVPAERILKKYDVLINSTGTGTAGRVAQLFDAEEPMTIDGHMILIRPTVEIDPIYYGYAVKAHQAEIELLAEGSTGQTEINRRRLESEVMISFPRNISSQKKIGKFLYQIDQKIKNNTAINNNLLEQAQAIFSNYYDSSISQQPFTSLIHVLGGGTPKTGNPDYWNGSIPFFTPKDVGAPYTFRTEKFITESGLEKCNSRLYPKNTSFVTARGTVGKVSLAGQPMAMNQSCYALESDTIDSVLVYFYVLKAVSSLKHKASGAVFDAIVTRDFETEVINVLSSEDSKIVLDAISPMMEKIHNNTKENIKLAALRDALLPRLMSGELDVSNLDL